jgi:outer membrane protein TolC
MVAACAAVALVSGCAVGPDFHRPPAPALPSYARPSLATTTAAAAVAGGEAQRFVSDQELAAPWWTLLQSPPLTALMDKALQASPTLVAAQAALRQALEGVQLTV